MKIDEEEPLAVLSSPGPPCLPFGLLEAFELKLRTPDGMEGGRAPCTLEDLL